MPPNSIAFESLQEARTLSFNTKTLVQSIQYDFLNCQEILTLIEKTISSIEEASNNYTIEFYIEFVKQRTLLEPTVTTVSSIEKEYTDYAIECIKISEQNAQEVHTCLSKLLVSSLQQMMYRNATEEVLGASISAREVWDRLHNATVYSTPSILDKETEDYDRQWNAIQQS